MDLLSPPADTGAFLDAFAFLSDATSHGFWDSKQQHPTSLTIFVPENYVSNTDGCFDELWYRHAVKGLVRVGGEGVQQLTTLSKLVMGLYPTASSSLVAHTDVTHAIGGVLIGSFRNIEFLGCIFHGIAASCISDLVPISGEVSSLRTCYLAGETINLRFKSAGISAENDMDNGYTLIASVTKPDRSPLGPHQKTTWLGNGTQCSIVLPNVPQRCNAMLWVSLYDNHLRHPMLTTTLPWYLVVQPNVNMHPNLRITDISRTHGSANDALWIEGEGFNDVDIRVAIGKNPAQVYMCSSTLVKCFVPPGSGTEPIWVVNGNVYTRFDSFTYGAPLDVGASAPM